jgi:hypothetical protein
MAQGSRSARVRHDGSELLGEGLPRTVWVETAEASDDEVKQDGHPTNGQIRESARVVAVDVRGSTLTRGADGTTSTAVRHKMDQVAVKSSLTKLQVAQVRKQGVDAHRLTSGAKASYACQRQKCLPE